MYKTQQWLSTLGFFWGEMYLFAYNWGNAIVVHHAVHQVLKFLVIWNFFQAAVEDASAAGGVLAFLHAHQYVIAFWNVVKPPHDKWFLKNMHPYSICLPCSLQQLKDWRPQWVIKHTVGLTPTSVLFSMLAAWEKPQMAARITRCFMML